MGCSSYNCRSHYLAYLQIWLPKNATPGLHIRSGKTATPASLKQTERPKEPQASSSKDANMPVQSKAKQMTHQSGPTAIAITYPPPPPPLGAPTHDPPGNINDEDNFPNHSDDPQPPAHHASKAIVAAYQAEVIKYTQSDFSAYYRSKMGGEFLWQNFITAFIPRAIKCWSWATLIECKDLLTQHGIYVEPDRTKPSSDAIIAVLYRQTHVGPPQINP